MLSNQILFLIVVHNKQIIDLYERDKKYANHTNYKYLLVGNHEEDYSSEIIIQCNKLKHHIEFNNHYLAYTAWHAVAKNDFITQNYKWVCLLEYDADFDNTFNLSKLQDEISKKELNCYGIACLDLSIDFLNKTQFSKKLREYFIHKNIKEIRPNNTKWIVTNNVLFDTRFLQEYINDDLTQDLFIYLKNDKMSGHFLERYLTAYCFIKNKTFGFIESINVRHKALDSHGTQDRKFGPEGYEKFKAINKISD